MPVLKFVKVRRCCDRMVLVRDQPSIFSGRKLALNLVKVAFQESTQLNHVSGATFCSCQYPVDSEVGEALGKRMHLDRPIHPSLEHSPQGFAGVLLNDWLVKTSCDISHS